MDTVDGLVQGRMNCFTSPGKLEMYMNKKHLCLAFETFIKIIDIRIRVHIYNNALDIQ